MVWLDALLKIEALHLGPLVSHPPSDTVIDVKLVCHKPLVMLTVCLNVFGNFGWVQNFGDFGHPSDIFLKALETGLISSFASQLLICMLQTSTELRAKLHKRENFSRKGEHVTFSEFSDVDKNFVCFCLEVFARMKKSVSMMIFYEGYQKFRNWNCVMQALSFDLVLHAIQIHEYFPGPWAFCLEDLPSPDGSRESTRVWEKNKLKILDSLLPEVDSEIFLKTVAPTILIEHEKGLLLSIT
jgi:hypothetical protein